MVINRRLWSRFGVNEAIEVIQRSWCKRSKVETKWASAKEINYPILKPL